jgi:WXG100 protein secretion system (Wss), protein YukD
MLTMQQTLFVTVQGAQRRLDVELPGDALVSDLIPLLLEMCNHPAESTSSSAQSKAPWLLSIANLDQPLSPMQTIVEGGVLDGDVLLLQTPDALNKGGAKTEERGFSRSIEPSAQTGMIGITWEKG